ncbi:MAG: topoisomerase C-terminal repeat-containing protein [Bdellovibrionota bacterium]
MGEVTDDVPKPKRASIPKSIKMTEITLEEAVHLLILPRTLGADPETRRRNSCE